MNKFKKKVIKQFPKAYAELSSNGIRIINQGEFLAEEFYMPNTHCEDTAWEYAAIACRVTQNFNRTHPMRMDLSAIESKINRINLRRRRSRKNDK